MTLSAFGALPVARLPQHPCPWMSCQALPPPASARHCPLLFGSSRASSALIPRCSRSALHVTVPQPFSVSAPLSASAKPRPGHKSTASPGDAVHSNSAGPKKMRLDAATSAAQQNSQQPDEEGLSSEAPREPCDTEIPTGVGEGKKNKVPIDGHGSAERARQNGVRKRKKDIQLPRATRDRSLQGKRRDHAENGIVEPRILAKGTRQGFDVGSKSSRSPTDRVRRRIPALAKLLHGTDSDVRQALEQIGAGNVLITVHEFNDVLSTLGRQRRLRAALSLIRVAETSAFAEYMKPKMTVKTFTIMIDVYGKARQLSRAFSLFYGMQRNGLVPNVVTYNAMVAACARNNEPDLAYEVFEEMQNAGLRPDKFTFGSLIDSCAKRGAVDRAFQISAMMDASGVLKDQTIYSALMDACGRVRQLDRALQVFEEMKRQGVWPNLITFAVLIDTCANAREPYKAFELFAEIKYWDLEPNVVTYTALIDACSKAGWPERAELVLQKMRENGVEPNEITYGALIDAWARNGSLDRAFQAVHRMAALDGVAPNNVLVGGLIEASRRLKDGSRVGDIWALIAQNNIRPAKGYYPSLIALAAFCGDIDTAIAIAAHCYARGLFRRSTCTSEDPTLRSLAYAMVCLRQVINLLPDEEQSGRFRTRIDPILESMSLDESKEASVTVLDAFNESNSLWESASEEMDVSLPDMGSRKIVAQRSVIFASRSRPKNKAHSSSASSLDARQAKDRAMWADSNFSD